MPYATWYWIISDLPYLWAGSDLTRPLVRALALNYVDQAEEMAHLAGHAKVQLPT